MTNPNFVRCMDPSFIADRIHDIRELFAGCTWVYAVYANPLIGFDCTLFVAEAGMIEFPVEVRS